MNSKLFKGLMCWHSVWLKFCDVNSEPEITQLDATGVHAYWAASRETCGDGKGQGSRP
jgi:hypothetical protein